MDDDKRQEFIDALMKKRDAGTGSILLGGPAGVGKTAMIKKIAEQLAAGGQQRPIPRKITIARPVVLPPGLAERFKTVVLAPMTQEELGKVLDILIDKHKILPENRRDEVKAFAHDMLQTGGYDEGQGVRGLRNMVEAIAAVSGAPDMAAALAEKFPVYGQRVSMKSGERLAESFIGGTAGATAPLKPLKLKSRSVGFFALH